TSIITLIDTVAYTIRQFVSSQPASFHITNNVVFSVDGTLGFVADYFYSNLIIFDVTTAGFRGVVGLVNGANPGHMALTPDGQLLTIVTTGLRTSGVGNYIAVIRTDTLLPFGTGQLRVSNADFATANNIVLGLNGIGYVASYGTNTVYVFDPFQ